MARVLVVDDEEILRFSFEKILSSAGHDVISAEHIIDARSILGANKFDVAVVDRILSDGCNGIELVEHISDTQPFCESILVSAFPSFTSAAALLDHKAFAYLTKPVEKQQLIQTVGKAASKSIKERESKNFHNALQTLFDTSQNAVIVSDLPGKIKYANSVFYQIFGIDRDETVDNHISDFLLDREKTQLKIDIENLISGNPVPERETRRITKDGKWIDVTVSLSLCKGQKRELSDLLFIIRDVTEKRRIENQLHHVQKIETVGMLASGIVHDLNNILAMIFGQTELLMEDFKGINSAQKRLDIILNAAHRSKELIQQILMFSRKGKNEMVPFKMHIIIQETLKLMKSVIPGTIEITEQIDRKASDILADPTQIHQLVMNLCTNAWQAMEDDDSGIMEVSLVTEEVDDDTAANVENLRQGTYVKLTVSDSGRGIDEKKRERIFQPFFTSKPEGTGLGLSIVNDIVKNHNGAIIVESSREKGTVFHVYLPEFKKSISEQEASSCKNIAEQSKILLIDYDKDLVKIIERLLSNRGYEVTALTDSADALEIFSSQPDVFDVVITEQYMPQITGSELSEKLVGIRSDIPVILFSGRLNGMSDLEAEEKGIKERISKPAGVATLDRTIQKVLKQRNNHR